MRVLILTNFGMGLFKFRKELIEQLIREKCEVYISLPKDEYTTKLEEMGCKFIDTKIDRRGTNPIRDLKLLLNYFKIIKKVKPHVVLSYTIKPNIYGGIVCKLFNIPYIVNVTGLGTAVENKSILQKITLLLYKFALKKASCVFFQNKENRDFFVEKKIVNGHHRLVPGSGVNLYYFNVIDYPSEDTINFVFISRVMKQKGIEQYLNAAANIKKKYPHTVFHVVGFCEEEYERKLKDLEKKGIIKYHGKIDDVREIYKISHCTIHPSFYPEGMSNVLLESAASGRPIITTDKSGCREIVEENKNGYIIKQKSTKDLIEKIEKFLLLSYEEKKQMGLAGRKKVEKEFDRQIVIDAYMEEIKKIAEGN